jgi:hypothetical protein
MPQADDNLIKVGAQNADATRFTSTAEQESVKK